MKRILSFCLLIVLSKAYKLAEDEQSLRRRGIGQLNSDVEIFNVTSVMEAPAHADIVSGKEAKFEKHPYQLQLAHNSSLRCGASIIHKLWAITAAHCVDGEKAYMLTLRAGAHRLDQGGSVHKVSKIIIHPRWDEDDFDYDIALLKVKEPFEFGTHVQKIALPHQGEKVLPEGAKAVASGWGYLEEDGDPSDTLQYVILTVVSRKMCQKALSRVDMYITDRMFCASKRGRDTCQGDSGGPLTSNGKLIGIVSWGVGCARPGFPGVYTRLNKLRYWIKEKTGI